MPDINYRELFPNIFKTGSEGISRQLYYDETMKRVNVGVYVDPKEKLSDSQIKEKDEKIRNALSKAWGFGERAFSATILDGTVDSFPDLIIPIGQLLRKREFVDKEGTSNIVDVGLPMDLEIDYFTKARDAVEGASKYNILSYEDTSIDDSSKIYNTFKHLYAYKHTKDPPNFSGLYGFLIFCGMLLGSYGIYVWENHATIPILIAMPCWLFLLATLGACCIFILQLLDLFKRFIKFKWLPWVRARDKNMARISALANLKEAEKLYHFYKL